jgi:F-type H+-transporting ATPase subunit gamma
MATLKEVQQRIHGVKNTQKITKAMKIVAATKLKKLERERKSARGFSQKIENMLQETIRFAYHPRHPLLCERKEGGRCGLIVIASDRGLCGGFNANLLRAAQEFIKTHISHTECELITIGKRAHDFFKNQGFSIMHSIIHYEKEDRLAIVDEITEKIVSSYMDGRVDSWGIIANKFSSKSVYGFNHECIIPVTVQEAQQRDDSLFLFEDDMAEALEYIIPRYISDYIYRNILESQNAEELARMMAMDQATENADELVGELTLFYNRTRQQVITKEISEIVGGAEALK